MFSVDKVFTFIRQFLVISLTQFLNFSAKTRTLIVVDAGDKSLYCMANQSMD